MIEATKFYIRYRVCPHEHDRPESEVIGWAEHGFSQLNVATDRFYGFGDIPSLKDLGPTVGVMGYVGDVRSALRAMGRPEPANVDYPEALKEFLGREITIGTLGDVRRHPAEPKFIKPLEHKAFTGFVLDGLSADSRRRVITQDDATPVYIVEPVEFVAEYRSFLLGREVLDCRKYRGDWSVAPDRAVVLAAVEAMAGHAPAAYCLDWGITPEGKTLLVEMNDGFSFGHYGLPTISYARMLSARWHEMASQPKAGDA